jgi:hypothetical protein
MRLFRQTKRFEWESVIAEVAEALKAAIAAGHGDLAPGQFSVSR